MANPRGPGAVANAAAEDTKRNTDKLNADYEHAKLSLMNYRQSVLRKVWKRLDPLTDEEKEALEREKEFGKTGKISTLETLTKIFPDGTYKLADGSSKILIVLKDGAASPIPVPKTLAEFKKTYSEILDFLAIGQGSKMVSIDWPNPNLVTEKYLDAFLELAEQKGLMVRFGNGDGKSNIDQFLASRESNSDFKPFMSDSAVRARKQKYIDRLHDLEAKYKALYSTPEYILADQAYNYKHYPAALAKNEKLPKNADGTFTDAGIQALKDRVLLNAAGNAPLAGDARMDAMSKRIDAIKARTQVLDVAKQSVEKDIKTCEDAVAGNYSADLKEKLVDKNNAGRIRTINEIQNEYTNLKKELSIWETELQRERNQVAAFDAPGRVLTDEEKAEKKKMLGILEQVDAVKAQLTSVGTADAAAGKFGLRDEVVFAPLPPPVAADVLPPPVPAAGDAPLPAAPVAPEPRVAADAPLPPPAPGFVDAPVPAAVGDAPVLAAAADAPPPPAPVAAEVPPAAPLPPPVHNTALLGRAENLLANMRTVVENQRQAEAEQQRNQGPGVRA